MKTPKGYLQRREKATKAEVRRAFDEAATKAMEAGVPFLAITVDTAVRRNTQYVFDGDEEGQEAIENTIEMGSSALMACLHKVPGELVDDFLSRIVRQARGKELARREGADRAV